MLYGNQIIELMEQPINTPEQPISILIVDDEPKNLVALEAMLDDPGYRLVRAQTPEQALLALVVEEFALLILDIRMPGMTGIELAQLIKERKKTARVPIIFLTAYYNEDQHVLAGYDTGAVDYLLKPANSIILRSKVAVFAELYRKSREVALANRNLLTEVSERRAAEERLRELNESLEQRVAERTELLKRADQRKDEFLATLAHELRNPLAPVRAAVELLRMKGPDDPDLQWTRDVIDRQMKAMTRIIDDLMDLSRINQGKVELRREKVDLAKIVQGAVETSRPLIEEMGHQLTMTLPSGTMIVDADLIRLAQVFMNLLNNSAKYTERGGRIDLRAEIQGGDVVVSVKDTGIGIPADKLSNIFEMFSQVEGTLTRSRGGLGVGLSLVKRLVELHGGSVTARSDGLGKGSEFIVRLPIVVDQTYANPASDDGHKAAPASDLRILVVDDNKDAAETLARLLQRMGNTVHTAHDGEEGVAAAQAFRPDVVLCDIGLPKLNGYEVCRLMKQQTWDKKMVMVAVTGWGQEDNKRKAQEAGFDCHLTKPVDPQHLLHVLAGLTAEMLRSKDETPVSGERSPMAHNGLDTKRP